MPKLVKLSFILMMILTFGWCSFVSAQEAPLTAPTPTPPEIPTEAIQTTPEEVAPTPVEVTLDETVTAIDFNLKEPKILPNSKLYFLKNWARGLRTAVTFDPIKKAELKLKYSSEKLLEAKKLAEKTQKPQLLEKAIENYQAEIVKIKEATDKIQEKSKQNPKVDKFLNKFTKQQILHTKILEKLEEKVPTSTLQKIEAAREKHLERFGEIMQKLEDDKEKTKERIKNAIKEMRGSEFKQFKGMQILKQMEEKAPEEIKETLQEIRENTLQEFKQNLEKMEAETQEKFKNYVEKVKGLEEKKMEIVEDLKTILKEKPAIKEVLEQTKEKMFEKIRERVEKNQGLKCGEVVKRGPDFCKEGRVIIKRDEQGCPVPECIKLGEEDIKIMQEKPSRGAAQDDTTTEGSEIIPGGTTPVPAPEVKPTPEKKPRERVCINLWEPVCGKDGKTYSNKCWAEVAGVEVESLGICEEKAGTPPINVKPTPLPTPKPRPVSPPGSAPLPTPTQKPESISPKEYAPEPILLPQPTSEALSPAADESSTKEPQAPNITPQVITVTLVTCCVNSACTRTTKEKCDRAGGMVVNAASCFPNPCQ